MNECETGYFKCYDNAECINTEGSYECNCNNGYDGEGNDCYDVNECEKGFVSKVLKVMVSHVMILMSASEIVTIVTATLNA